MVAHILFDIVMVLLIRLQIILVSIASNWKRVFILSCVAVSFDCLFLYIPIIDQENKCLGSDKTLRNVALALRSLTDITFIFHIKILTKDGMDEGPRWDDISSDTSEPAAKSWWRKILKLVRDAIAEKMPWLSIYIVVNFLAILPIPQVAIVVGFSRLGDGTAEDAQTMRRLDRVGEEVVRWAILNYNKWSVHRDSLPISPVDIKCLTKIGAFTFTADELIDLCRILGVVHDISKNDDRIKDWLLRNGFPEDLKANIMNCLDQNKLLGAGKMNADDVDVDFLFGILPEYIKPSIKRHLGMRALKKVPMLRKLHEYALEIICNHLEPVVYMMNSYVVRAGKPLGFMIFILEGKVIITSSSEITELSDENVIERGCYYGEQLLSWAAPNNISSSDNPVISTRDVKCQTKVEALILKAEDLKSAASKCGSQWNFNNCMNSQQVVDVGKDRAANTAPTSTIEEEAIQLHQGHDMILEQLVLIRETIFRRLDDIRSGIRDHGTKLDDQGRRLDDQGRRLDDMAAFLAKVGYTGLTGTSSTPSAL
ncbi:hypothetical protein ACLB2K_023558 [Fragaria x ananassa]